MAIQENRPLQGSPARASAVAFTAEMITGVIMGRKRMGSTISRAPVLTASAENRVPTATKPTVANKVTVITGREITG